MNTIETNTIIPIMLPIASPDKVYALSVSAMIASVQLPSSPSFIVGIFEVKPHFDAITGEILGTLHTSNAGTATVQLNVYIKINDVQTQVFTRTLYIVKN